MSEKLLIRRGTTWETLYVDDTWVAADARIRQEVLDRYPGVPIEREQAEQMAADENVVNCWCAKCMRFRITFFDGPSPFKPQINAIRHVRCDACGYVGYSHFMDDGTDYWFTDESNQRKLWPKVKSS